MNVVNFEDAKKLKEKEAQEKEMTLRCRNFNALVSELALVINKHVGVYGTSEWAAVGASLVCLSQCLAKSDPNLDHPGLRDRVHELLDKHCDEALVHLWEREGLPS